MPCPTCSHTLVRLIATNFAAYWHCPRCGTVVVSHPDNPANIYVPTLVERCRQFELMLDTPELPGASRWRYLSIAESINLPGERPG